MNSPKGTLLVLFAGITTIAVLTQGVSQALPGVLIATATAALLDVTIVAFRKDKLEFPDGAILTGLIIALVLRPQEPWSVEVTASALAIAAKHVLRTRWSNVLNPSAIGLVGVGLLFGSAQSWWGALPDIGIVGVALISAAGLFMVDRINKLPLVLTFFGTYFALFTGASFLGSPVDVAEIFRTPDLQAALFFGFFMLDDPPTCPIRYEDQIPFAVIVAITCFLVFTEWGVVYFLPAGLLAGNVWESARRQFASVMQSLRAKEQAEKNAAF